MVLLAAETASLQEELGLVLAVEEGLVGLTMTSEEGEMRDADEELSIADDVEIRVSLVTYKDDLDEWIVLVSDDDWGEKDIAVVVYV